MTDTRTPWEFLDRLAQVIASRKGGDAKASYVASLFAKGRKKIAEKVGEEAVETATAAVLDDKKQIVYESADLLFHLLVLWEDAGIKPQEVLHELERREGTSGIAEKNARSGKP